MTEIAPDAYSTHIKSLVLILAQTLSRLDDLGQPAAVHILNTLRHLIPLVKHDETVSIIQ